MYTNPTFLKTVPPNVEGRDFVVGDIHGCFDEFERLLKHVKFDPEIDRVFCTGDLVDRGPKSFECLSLLKKKWFFSTLGNHEDMLLNKINDLRNGNTKSLENDDITFIKSLDKFSMDIIKMPLVYEIEHLLLDKIYIIHSEILPEHIHNFTTDDLSSKDYHRLFDAMKTYDFSKQIEEFFENNKNLILDYNLKQKILWGRKFASTFHKDHNDLIKKGDFSFLKQENIDQKIKVFCGHNVVPFPMKIGQQYYMDTGAALGYSQKQIKSYLFSQYGHEFFMLSMADITTGVCYACITSENRRFEIVRLEKSLYEN